MPTLTHINPEGLHQHPAFTQAVLVPAGAATLYVGGQNGTDATGQVVSPDAGKQARQAFLNLEACVQAAGAELTDVAKWTIFVDSDESIQAGFAAFMEFWGDRGTPPAITVARVAGFARPEVRCEIEAVAVVPSP